MAQTTVTMQAGQTLTLPFQAPMANNGTALTTPDPDFNPITQYSLSDPSFGSVGSFPVASQANFKSNGKVGTVTITGSDSPTSGTGDPIIGTQVVTVEGDPATDLIITPGTAS